MLLRLPIILTILSCIVASKLNVVHEWKYIDFVWDSEEQRKSAIADGRYNYTQIYTIDAAKAKDGRVFVTTRTSALPGSPVSLATVSRKKGPGGPLLRPYPNWSWHYPRNCKKIISVVRLTIDKCNRLWVIDSGRIASTQLCPAQILAFDLKTNKLYKRIVIPQELSHDPKNTTQGLFVQIAVETEGKKCDRTWVYAADARSGGLVVWDKSNLWRIDNAAFNGDPKAANVSIAGDSYSTTDGIIGLSVSPGTSSKYRRLYFRPLASFKEHSFSAHDLHKSRKNPDKLLYTTSKYTLPSQGTTEAFSKDGILFFGLTNEIAIGCWNSKTYSNKKHVDIVAQDDETLQFASGLHVRNNPRKPHEEQLWVMTNRLQKLFTRTQNFDEINFRVLTGSVDSLVKGSKCEVCRGVLLCDEVKCYCRTTEREYKDTLSKDKDCESQ